MSKTSRSTAPRYSPWALGGGLLAGGLLGFAQSEEDKRKHVWAGSAIAATSAWTFNHLEVSRLWSSVGGFALGVLAGYLKENYDAAQGRSFDYRDWNATNLGAGGAILVLNLPVDW